MGYQLMVHCLCDIDSFVDVLASLLTEIEGKLDHVASSRHKADWKRTLFGWRESIAISLHSGSQNSPSLLLGSTVILLLDFRTRAV